MKSGTSSLNPFAESYIPLSKREPKNEGKTSEITAEKSPKSSGETTWFDTRSQGPKETKQIYLQSDASFDLNIHGIEELLIGEDFMKKGHENPSNETEKYYTDEDSQMDLAYLGTLFPGISDQSLLDVYTANGGDLEASIDMLNQLEFGLILISKTKLPSHLFINFPFMLCEGWETHISFHGMWYARFNPKFLPSFIQFLIISTLDCFDYFEYAVLPC
ncbi:hypothetical protein AAG906_009600 [Vitis piasezkii]